MVGFYCNEGTILLVVELVAEIICVAGWHECQTGTQVVYLVDYDWPKSPQELSELKLRWTGLVSCRHLA
jgi:hypothetical protein